MPRYLLLDSENYFDEQAKAYRIVNAPNHYLAEGLLKQGKVTLRSDVKNFPKARILLQNTLYDSRYYALMPYEDYAKMCSEEDVSPKPKDSQAYYDDIADRTDTELDDFKSNLEDSEYNKPCILTGYDELWNGQNTLCPVIYNSLLEGIEDIMRRADCDDWKIILTEGYLELRGLHHDGTNIYELHLLSAKGRKEIGRPKYTWEGHDYDPKPDWFKNIYGWLY